MDGCFLKGISKGQLLVAVAKDENNQMLSIAWDGLLFELRKMIHGDGL